MRIIDALSLPLKTVEFCCSTPLLFFLASKKGPSTNMDLEGFPKK